MQQNVDNASGATRVFCCDDKQRCCDEQDNLEMLVCQQIFNQKVTWAARSESRGTVVVLIVHFGGARLVTSIGGLLCACGVYKRCESYQICVPGRG